MLDEVTDEEKEELSLSSSGRQRRLLPQLPDHILQASG